MGILESAKNWATVGTVASYYAPAGLVVAPLLPHRRLSAWVMHRWAKRCADGMHIARELVNPEHIEAAGQCVMVANHRSLLDILVIGSLVNRDYRWLSKASIFRVPLLGWHLTLAGHIKVYRGEERHRNTDIQERIGAALTEGASVLFFPEGTRSREDELKSFKRGAFVTAVQAGLPVLPLALRGTGHLLKKGSLDLTIDRSCHCSVTALPPLRAREDGTFDERVDDLMRRAHAAMAHELGVEA